MAALRRASVGFKGGQTLAIRVTEDSLRELRKAVGGDGWHDVETEESTVAIDLAQVVYLSVESAEQHVGFS